MKSTQRLIALIFLSFVLAPNLYGGQKEAAKPEKSEPIKVALVYDVGGRGDKSFNDAAYLGLVMAKDKLGINYLVAEPTEGTDREVHLRRFANSDAQLVLGIGILFSEDITKLAREFPQKKFTCIDYNPSETGKVPANLLGIRFREHEGSFLVGAIAGLFTKTNKLGFVGGCEIPLIKKFETGYTAGVNHVNPQCQVMVTYAGVTGEAFANPVKGKELALSLYNAGCDIIFHASGSTGLGVFKAAEEMDKYAIGVDADQSGEAQPGTIISSMIKKVEVAVFEAIKAAQTGQFRGGIKEFGLKEGYIDYVYNDSNRHILGETIHKKVEELKAKIISGEITVPYK